MPYNSKVMARARALLSERREANAAEAERRLRAIYARIPEIEEIDAALRMQMPRLAALVISGAEESDVLALREENLSLQMRRAELLTENGLPSTWLDEIFTCPVCRDSGNTPSGVCSCLLELYNRELTEELSVLLRSGSESFEHFDLRLYPERSRERMQRIRDLGKQFAEYFPAVDSLLFTGSPGLGKTYLSACIAREVASSGRSVVYDTCSSVVTAFEKQQFGRDAEAEEASQRVQAMLHCDLMILDDLGTEFTTPGALSALYTLINTRISENRPMIISTNLSSKELARRYTPAIVSRMEGCFLILEFEGEDIRKLLKENNYA